MTVTSRSTPRAWTRRSFLTAAGASTALLPLLPYLERDAEAAGGVSKRLVVVTHGNGVDIGAWRPSGGETGFQLPSILAPFEQFRDRLLVVDGLDNEAYERNVVGDFHNGYGSLWTGMPVQGSEGNVQNDGTSVDQFIADAIGGDSLISSIHAGLLLGGSAVRTRCHYRGPNSRVEPDQDPRDLFDRVFADLALDPQEFDRLRTQRLSMVDAVKGDLEALGPQLSGNDRHRMELHLAGIRALEQRLQGQQPACSIPSTPGNLDAQSSGDYEAVVDAHTDLIVHALACDVTRVATLQLGREGSTGNGSWVNGWDANGGIHTVSHGRDGNAQTNMRRLYEWYGAKVAALVDRLANTPDADGGMLLDNTLVVWGSAMSNGWNHASRNIPFVLVEGKNGYFRTGRHVRYGAWEVDDAPHSGHGGEPHNRLLVSLCHAMGLAEQQTYGLSDLGGALGELI